MKNDEKCRLADIEIIGQDKKNCPEKTTCTILKIMLQMSYLDYINCMILLTKYVFKCILMVSAFELK